MYQLRNVNVRVVAYESVNCVEVVEERLEWDAFDNTALELWVS
jgi:hypothetical protein